MSRVLPILFNTEMVRAILDSRKTVTRRAVKYKYSNTEMKMHTNKYGTRLIEIQQDIEGETHGKKPDGSTYHKILPYIEKNPPYKKGDIMYVRETWSINNLFLKDMPPDKDDEFYVIYEYKTDGSCTTVKIPEELYNKYEESMGYSPEWRPSIHMPKEAARIWLKVTDVRAERLQEITERQIWAEGTPYDQEEYDQLKRGGMAVRGRYAESYLRGCFMDLWNATIKKADNDRYGWSANPWVWVIEFERCEKPESEG